MERHCNATTLEASLFIDSNSAGKDQASFKRLLEEVVVVIVMVEHVASPAGWSVRGRGRACHSAGRDGTKRTQERMEEVVRAGLRIFV